MSIHRDETSLRPVADSTADVVVRCIRCRHALHAEESVRAELGPVCRRIVADLAEVA